MEILFGIIICIVFLKLFFAVGSGIIRLTLGLVGLIVLFALLPLSLVLLIPIGIVILLVSLFIGLIQWIL